MIVGSCTPPPNPILLTKAHIYKADSQSERKTVTCRGLSCLPKVLWLAFYHTSGFRLSGLRVCVCVFVCA